MGPFLEASTDSAVRPNENCKECGLYMKEGVIAEESTEAKPNKGLNHGIKPSKKEVDEHERTHLPFRSWCAHCVRGKGQSHPHWNKSKEDCGIPTISWDYVYMKGDGPKYSEDDMKDEMPV